MWKKMIGQHKLRANTLKWPTYPSNLPAIPPYKLKMKRKMKKEFSSRGSANRIFKEKKGKDRFGCKESLEYVQLNMHKSLQRRILCFLWQFLIMGRKYRIQFSTLDFSSQIVYGLISWVISKLLNFHHMSTFSSTFPMSIWHWHERWIDISILLQKRKKIDKI